MVSDHVVLDPMVQDHVVLDHVVLDFVDPIQKVTDLVVSDLMVP